MSQGPLHINLTKKVQKDVSQMANCNLSCMMLKSPILPWIQGGTASMTPMTLYLEQNVQKKWVTF